MAFALAIPTHAQDTPTTLTAAFQQVLDRESNGHSPTDEDIAAIAVFKPVPTPADVKSAAQLLPKLLACPDAPARIFALTALTGLEAPAPPAPLAPAPLSPDAAPTPPPSATPETTQTQPPAATGPLIFPSAAAAALAPAVPAIAARLTDDLPPIRLLAATVLGGFTPAPPPTVYPPLLAFLKREDAPGATGQAAVADLLQLGPLTPEVAEAIAKFLHRPDQDQNTRANLVDAIATSPNQSQTLNKSLLTYLSADDPSLRARIILSLPALDLAPDVFADTRTRISQLVDDPGENLQVVNAAKAVAPCWNSTKMTSGCPVY